jgi:hypothetical protein
MSMRKGPVVLGAFLLTVGGCNSGTPSSASNVPNAGETGAQVVVTRDDRTLPPGCRPAEVARLVSSFFSAFNRGGQRQLASFFGPVFPWYSVNENEAARSFMASNRDDLLKYFAQRHAHYERLRLLKIRVGASNAPGNRDIVFLLTRQADDLQPVGDGPELLADGKGSIDCEKRTIFVWVMGMGGGFGECPDPPAGTPATAIVACAR